MQSVDASVSAGDVLNQVGGLAIDVNGQAPVRSSIAEQSCISSGGNQIHGARRGGNNVDTATSQDNSIVDVRSIHSGCCQEDVVLRILRIHCAIVGGCDNVYGSTVQVERTSLTLNAHALEIVSNASIAQRDFLDRKSHGPELGRVQNKDAISSSRNGIDSVLSAIQQTHLNAISNNVG